MIANSNFGAGAVDAVRSGTICILFFWSSTLTWIRTNSLNISPAKSLYRARIQLLFRPKLANKFTDFELYFGDCRLAQTLGWDLQKKAMVSRPLFRGTIEWLPKISTLRPKISTLCLCLLIFGILMALQQSQEYKTLSTIKRALS